MDDQNDRGCETQPCPCGSTLTGVPMVVGEAVSGNTLRYVQCMRCGLWRMTPQPSDSVLAKCYGSAYYGQTRTKFVGPVPAIVAAAQRARAKNVLRNLAIPRPRILDIGCGNGGFLAAARDLGAESEGTELSAESAARASGLHNVVVHTGGLGQLVEEGNKYDAITMWHVIEHVRDPSEQLSYIRNLLRPGGLLFVSAPNHDSWQASLFRERWFHLDPPRHLWGFSPKSLRLLVSQYGFTTLRFGTLSLEQNPYGILQSILNCTWMPRDSAYETLKGMQRNYLTIIRDLTCVGILTLPSLIASLVESAAGRGGTFCLVAQKDSDVQE